MSKTVKKLLALDTESKQARQALRTAQADVTKVTARNTIRQAQEERADLLEKATDDEFHQYIAARNS
jgi:hypothetical protein